MFSVRSLTSSEARVVAEAYLKCGRNPNKIGEALGLPDFDKEILAHPLVRREVIAIARVNAQTYSMVDHLEKLAEIRDLALDDKKYTAALGAEMAIGKAAGLYDRAGDDPDDTVVEPTKLTSQQIRDMLARRGQEALPAPQEGNELEAEGIMEDDPEDFFREADPPDDGLP